MPASSRFTIHNGDVLAIAKSLPDNSFDGCFSDPPYGLSQSTPGDLQRCLDAWLAGEVYTHGKNGFLNKSWDAWVPGPEVWREVFRVLKPGARCAVFAGTRTQDLMRVAMELANFEHERTLAWAYPSGFPKNHSVFKHWEKQATQTGASLSEVQRGFEGHGTAMKPSVEPVLVMRKPGNVVQPPALTRELFYFSKPRTKERNAGLDALPDQEWSAAGACIPERANRPFLPVKNTHPTLKSLSLNETLVSTLFGRGGNCLVPYSGSGSEVIGALLGGFDTATGIELNPGYVDVAKARVGHWVKG